MLAEKINDIIRGMPVTDLSENSFSSVRQPFWTRDQFIEFRAARDSTVVAWFKLPGASKPIAEL
jgi:hypothetical protein